MRKNPAHPDCSVTKATNADQLKNQQNTMIRNVSVGKNIKLVALYAAFMFIVETFMVNNNLLFSV